MMDDIGFDIWRRTMYFFHKYWGCHQMATRSFFFKGFQFPLCARCTGILVGAAMQVVYIALVTPGGTVSADVRAVSYIGIPLAMIALKSYGLDAATADGAAMATSFGTMVGTLGKSFTITDCSLLYFLYL